MLSLKAVFQLSLQLGVVHKTKQKLMGGSSGKYLERNIDSSSPTFFHLSAEHVDMVNTALVAILHHEGTLRMNAWCYSLRKTKIERRVMSVLDYITLDFFTFQRNKILSP